jgi:large subunit ribosomal protein L22
MSPSKARVVLDIVRGKSYSDAVAILENTVKGASDPIRKALNSAAANAENNLNMSKSDLYVAEAFADAGPTLKRMIPKARGSGARINKRTCHITVILDERKKK